MDGKIIINEYTSEWKKQFQQEGELLTSILKEKAIKIEHIGSTAVEGLASKSLIDLMLGVHELGVVDAFIEPLAKIGYEQVMHEAFPNRRFFRKGKWRAGTHHLHVYVYSSEEWTNQLLFRDYLRSNQSVREAYANLKIDLANQYPYDRVSYTNAKSAFIETIIVTAKSQ
ncbi:GrpB family protein [Metabacillus iocasae]|uniref:GrpB-like predicted nucleotidyltransferase (UPF0157 family) n=1 Tax=Priestia iocasae TaxID=2291674 RepID=A0ABS2QVU3_9BACI|nr:GrpB family protein [Metabacillus iocasae]MBM7703600.1 GrpB-like predicted nucleotidyltransferase (UPF0157 family) [Metabacillus iocasae]